MELLGGGSSTSLTAELPWPRCAVPQVDQVSGQRHKEPALALKAHRWCTEAPTLSASGLPTSGNVADLEPAPPTAPATADDGFTQEAAGCGCATATNLGSVATGVLLLLGLARRRR